VAKIRCEKADCTVAVTGTCLLSNPEPAKCEHYRIDDGVEEDAPLEPGVESATGSTSIRPARQFHSGLELGTDDSASIMRRGYTHFLAVLGYKNAGKTSLLNSLYLMASHGMLSPKFEFAGCLTLQGFEDRVKRLRQWPDGVLPESLAEHTSSGDPRNPALLHISLRQLDQDGRRLELLLTDLPGEWSRHLVERVQTAPRFDFIKRADAVILVIDGPALVSPATRHNEDALARLLLQRIKNDVGLGPEIPVVLLLSKCDEIDMKTPELAASLQQFAASLGLRAQVHLSAAFSNNVDKVKNGAGIVELIESVVNAPLPTRDSIPKGGSGREGDRPFLTFRTTS
jgi:double-GTPase-like protein